MIDAAPSSGRRLRRDSSRVLPPTQRGGRLCERQELLASLDESLQTRVTLMIAPTGFGKTTLLAQWCRRLTEQHIPIAYYAASNRERDPTMFLAMIASALNEAGIDTGDRPAFDDGRVRDDIVIEDILLGLELAGQPLVLIIDDFERVNDPAITALMTALIDGLPPSLHLVIASRIFPAIPLSGLEVEGKLRLIDAYQLRLRPEELAWMLEIDVETSELKEIAARTHGWPVTAELYRLWRLRHRSHDARATFGGHVAEVQNYLTEQLFSSLPAEQYELLVDIADRDEVSAELVDAMRQRHDSARLLAAVAHSISSLMWTGQENGTTVYRLYPLLIEHLRPTLAQDVERQTRISINAALWLLDRLRYPEAVKTAIESRDPATIDRVLRALRPIHILVADGATTLRMILREIPDTVIARHPRLQIMAAIAHFKAGFFGESRAMVARIREATRNFSIDPDGRPDWLTIDGSITDLIALCQMSRCSDEVESLYEVIMGCAADDPVIWGAGEIVMMLVRQVRGDFDAADAAIQRARGIYNTVELSRYSHTQIVGHEVLILTARGHLRRAVELIRTYQKQPGFEVPDDISTPTLLRLMLAAIRYEQEFGDTAVEALKNSFAEHSEAESWFDQYAIAHPPMATRLFMREGMDAVLVAITEAQIRAQRVGLEALPDFLTFMEIEYRARGGDPDGASALAERIELDSCVEGRDRLAAVRGWRERDAAMQALIRLKFARRRPEEAMVVARALTRAGQTGGRLRSEIKGRIFSSLAAAMQGHADAAGAELLKAVLLAYPQGFVAPFAEEGEELLPVVDAQLMAPGLDAYARRHLDDVRRAIVGAMVRTDANQLNLREREIVGHLAEGLSNKVIARRMGITDHTVKFHLKKIFSKLEVSSRRAAVAKVQSGDG